MKHDTPQIPAKHTFACCLLVIALLSGNCTKEKTLQPTNLDENIFVVKDNPDDPVDHAIYQFYQNTGIPCFYNDTIQRKKIGDSAGIPRYTYVKLSLGYYPLGVTNSDGSYPFELLASKQWIPSFLELIKTELLPVLPSDLRFTSFLLIDSLINPGGYPILDTQLSDGWATWHGFNTVAIAVKNVAAMNTDERKMYVAAILAGIVEKRLNSHTGIYLQRDFFSISRSLANTMFGGIVDAYWGIPLFLFLPPQAFPQPEELAFLKFIKVNFQLGGPDDFYKVTLPRESDDLRFFLTATFYYSTQEFNQLYVNEPLIQQKGSVLRKMVKEAGFRFPD